MIRLRRWPVFGILVLTSILSSCTTNNRPIRLVIQEDIEPQQTVYQTLLRAGELLDERTTGRITLAILEQGAPVDSVENTVCIFTLPAINGLANYYRPVGALEAPYMFRDLDHFYRTVESPTGQALLREVEIRSERKILDVWHLGVRQVTLRTRAATTPDEFGYVKLRVPPALMSVEVAKVLGALPTTITFKDVYVNLRAGMIDGQENPLPTIKAMGFYRQCTYLVLTNHVIATTVPAMPDYHWTKLSPEDRYIILQAFRDVRQYNRQLIEELEDRLVAELTAEGMEVLEPDEEPFRRRAAQSWRRFQDVWGDSLVSMIQAVR